MSRRAIVRLAAGLVAGSLAACSYSYVVRGRLVADDGRVGLSCAMSVSPPGSADGTGRECYSPEVKPETGAGPWIVLTGSEIQCSVSGNTDELYELRVRCPGFRPLDVPLAVEACTRFFSNCDAIDVGTLTVRR